MHAFEMKMLPVLAGLFGVAFAGRVDAQGRECRPQDLRLVAVGEGPEDLEWDAKRSRLLISSAIRSGPYLGYGRIQALHLPIGQGDSAEGVVRDLKVERPANRPPFHPIGLSLVNDGDATLLYVVVSSKKKGVPHAVERFLVEDDRLVYQRPFESELLNDPNDVLALRGDELYVSNASGSRSLVKKLWEHAFKRRWSSVSHHRQGHWSVGAPNIAFPNGLAFDEKRERLWIASFNARQLLSFRRDPADGSLARVDTEAIALEAHPDNLMWDGDRLLVAAHPSRRKTLCQIADQELNAPSVVYAVGQDRAIDILYSEHGERISGSSTAFIHEGVLHISQVRRGEIGVCVLSPK